MATTVVKDVLYPGVIRKPGRDPLPLTGADIDNAVTAANTLIRDGYTIPFYWEHQPDEGPVKLSSEDKPAHVAKHTFGHVAEAFKDEIGVLQLKLHVEDDKDAERLPKVRFVSPELRKDWKDSEGRVWKGWTISHVAATPVPVQRQQKPFDPTAAIRLSLADYYPLSTGDADTYAGGKPSGNGSPADGLDAGKPSSGNSGAMTKCLINLAKHGIKLPDDTSEENLCERLNIVLDALPSDDEENDMPTDPEGDDVQEAREAQPIAMSLAKQEQRAAKFARQDINQRIQKLVNTGRITPEIGSKLTAQAGKVQLSFNDEGEVEPNALLIKIEAYEALPRNSSWKPKADKVRLSESDVREVDDAPDGTHAKSTAETLAAWDKT